MPRLHLPPGTPLWSRSVVQFSCYYIFFIFTRFLFVICFLFFLWTKAALANCCSCLPEAQKSSSRETEEKESEWDGQSVGENKKRICGASANNCAGCMLRCCAACRRSVPFHSDSFHFVSFRTHGIPWHCNSYCNAKMCLPLLKLKGSWQTRPPPYSLCVGVARIALCQWHFIACFWAWIEKLPDPQTHSKCPPAARTEVRIMLATENCSS